MEYDLVFEGGGAKGGVLVGAYEIFAQQGHTHGRLLGTSAGAIVAVLLAAGYTVDELLAAMAERENGRSVFNTFLADPASVNKDEILDGAIGKLMNGIDFTFIPDFFEKKIDQGIAGVLANHEKFRHIYSFVERGGWYSAENFVPWLENKLNSGSSAKGKRAYGKMTLAEFYDATGSDFSVIAANIWSGRMLVLNHRTAPNCPVAWAVRMSMNIPLLWQEVKWQKAWGKYGSRDIVGEAIVDGGMLSNFPIELFLSDEAPVTKVMGPKQGNPVIGFLVDDATRPSTLPSSTLESIELVKSDIAPSELETVTRINRLLNTMMTAHDKMVMDEFDHVVVRLPAAGFDALEFDMSDERREALVESGRIAMRKFLADQPKAPSLESVSSWSRKVDRIATSILSDL